MKKNSYYFINVFTRRMPNANRMCINVIISAIITSANTFRLQINQNETISICVMGIFKKSMKNICIIKKCDKELIKERMKVSNEIK